MSHLTLPPGNAPAARADHGSIERFRATKKRWRVWLLDTPIPRQMHWRDNKKSKPCLKPGQCPLCEAVHWSEKEMNIEGHAPVLVFDPSADLWVPKVGFFTAKALEDLGDGPHAGKVIYTFRELHGNSPWQRVELAEKTPVLPPIPPFEIETHLLWFWFDKAGVENLPPRTPLPQPVKARRQNRTTLTAVPFAQTELSGVDVRKLLREGGWGADDQQPAPTLKFNGPAAPKPSGNGHAKKPVPPILSLEDAAEAERLRAARRKPADELTAPEAVEAHREIDFILAGVAAKNGTHKPKGGAQ